MAPSSIPLARVVAASQALAATRGKHAKVDILAALFQLGLAPEISETLAAWLTGTLVGGPIGVGYAAVFGTLAGLTTDAPADGSPVPLEVHDVVKVLSELRDTRGAGSAARRAALLSDLFGRASAAERDFLTRLLTGEMRQGALDGLLVPALAKAFATSEASVQKAVMLAGSLPAIARALATGGPAALDAYRLELFRPVLPMLADTAESFDDAETDAEVDGGLGAWAIEPKLDGARIQVHKDGSDIRVYTRALNDVTQAVPEVVEAVAAYAAKRLVLDGEVLALRAGGRPEPFQTTMRRFGTKLDVATLRAEIPLYPFFFDILLNDEGELLTCGLAERRRCLESVVPARDRVFWLPSPERARAEAFLAETLALGHEGVMLKRLDAAYEAGRRGSSWLKLKPAHTLDLVVIAVERGSGRRAAWLSNLHLAAYDPDTHGFVMLGKTFKGMTDALLEWQTRELGAREIAREGHVIHVRPELVVETAFQEFEVSPRYPAGLALRFARVKGYRPDKRPDEADTIATVRALFARQRGGE